MDLIQSHKNLAINRNQEDFIIAFLKSYLVRIWACGLVIDKTGNVRIKRFA